MGDLKNRYLKAVKLKQQGEGRVKGKGESAPKVMVTAN
jgi:hypothetical protein